MKHQVTLRSASGTKTPSGDQVCIKHQAGSGLQSGFKIPWSAMYVGDAQSLKHQCQRCHIGSALRVVGGRETYPLGKLAVNVDGLRYLASESRADDAYARSHGRVPPPMPLVYDSPCRHSDSAGVGEPPHNPNRGPYGLVLRL